MRTKNKSEAQFRHARKRFKDRLGIEYTREIESDILKLIQSNRSIPIEVQSLRITKHLIEYQGKEFIVVYDKLRKTIVTCLFPERVIEE